MMEVKMLNYIIYVLKNMEMGLFGHSNEFLDCAFEMTVNQVICADHLYWHYNRLSIMASSTVL
jgi:hypothetical protein